MLFTYSMRSGLNLSVEVSSVPALAFSCVMLQEKDLTYITAYSHDTEAVQMSEYRLDAFFCNWFWIRNGILGMIHGASHSFVLAKSFSAWPSGICWYWQAFIDLIHSPSLVCVCVFFFQILLQQLHIGQMYWEKPLQIKANPQPPPQRS